MKTCRQFPSAAGHRLPAAAFWIVVVGFCLHYVLIHAGVVENQVPPSKRAAPPGSVEVEARRFTAAADDFARENAWGRIPFSELNMGFRRLAGMRLFPDSDDVLRLDNGYLLVARKRVDVDYAARQIIGFRDDCENLGFPFLYVVLPTKAARKNPGLPPGMEDHCNDNADRLVNRLADAGVPTLDLRDGAQAAFPDYFNLFYRTDHHWKPEAGLWAAREIADDLNRRYAFGLPSDLLAPTGFAAEVYPRYFLGSQGKKVTRAIAAPEDFHVLSPTFDTAFVVSIRRRDNVREGDFRRVFIADRHLARRDLYRLNPYGAYAHGDQSFLSAVNRRLPEGKRLLILKDSFANVVTPYLALVAGRLDVLDLRWFTGRVRAFVEHVRPDAVVVLYNAGGIPEGPEPDAEGRGDLYRFD